MHSFLSHTLDGAKKCFFHCQGHIWSPAPGSSIRAQGQDAPAVVRPQHRGTVGRGPRRLPSPSKVGLEDPQGLAVGWMWEVGQRGLGEGLRVMLGFRLRDGGVRHCGGLEGQQRFGFGWTEFAAG